MQTVSEVDTKHAGAAAVVVVSAVVVAAALVAGRRRGLLRFIGGCKWSFPPPMPIGLSRFRMPVDEVVLAIDVECDRRDAVHSQCEPLTRSKRMRSQPGQKTVQRGIK